MAIKMGRKREPWTQRLDHVHAHHQGRGWLLHFATTTVQRMTVSVTRVFYMTRGRPRASAVGLLQRSWLDFLPVNSADCSPFSTRQRDWSTASIVTTTLHHCCSCCTGCHCQNEWHSNSASWYIAVCMVSAL